MLWLEGRKRGEIFNLIYLKYNTDILAFIDLSLLFIVKKSRFIRPKIVNVIIVDFVKAQIFHLILPKNNSGWTIKPTPGYSRTRSGETLTFNFLDCRPREIFFITFSLYGGDTPLLQSYYKQKTHESQGMTKKFTNIFEFAIPCVSVHIIIIFRKRFFNDKISPFSFFRTCDIMEAKTQIRKYA